MVDEWDDTVAALPGTLEAELQPREAHLVVIRGNNLGERVAVVGPDMVIGRAAGVDLRLHDEGVSRFHCRLRHQTGDIYVEDLGSRNGTFCNGERIAAGSRALEEGDCLQIGTTSVLRFTFVAADERPTPIPENLGIDPLTGAFSRRRFVDHLEREVTTALAQNRSLSLVLVHIDRFNELCQSRPPKFSDEITIGASTHIRDSIRKDDIIARIAVGEFALMMRLTSPGDTFMQAERLRASNKTLTVTTTDGPQQITLSIGIAALGEVQAETAHDLLVAAGSALHRARSQGGNRVVLCTQDLLQEPKSRAKV